MAVVCIITAAGASRRLGHPKQLVRVNARVASQVDGETLIERSVRIAHQAGVERVLVVLGAHAQRIRQVLEATGLRLTMLDNMRWQQGLSTSITLGVEHAMALPQCEGALLMVCDQPYLSSVHLQTLLRAFDAHQRQRIVASGYDEIVGIPAIFPVASFPALMELSGDAGARSLLRSSDAKAGPVVVPCPAASLDLDTPEDEARLAQDGGLGDRRQTADEG